MRSRVKRIVVRFISRAASRGAFRAAENVSLAHARTQLSASIAGEYRECDAPAESRERGRAKKRET